MTKYTLPRPSLRSLRSVPIPSARRLISLILLFGLLTLPLLWAARRPLAGYILQRAYQPPQCVLINGLDDSQKRVDCIMLLFMGHGAPPRLLIVPRDTLTENGKKLNGRWSEGPEKFKVRLEKLLDCRIDRHMAIPFKKLPRLLDAAFPAGLSINVPYRLRYADRKAGFAYNIAPGRQTLKSPDLVALLRDRYSAPRRDGEVSRANNWKIFMREARHELSRPANLPRLAELARIARQVFKTDMSDDELAGLAATFVMASDFTTSRLPTRPHKSGKVWIEHLNITAARCQVKLAQRGIAVPSGVRVWVLNGTKKPGLARRSAARLSDHFGVPVARGNAAEAHVRRTRVEYSRPDLAPLARELASDIGAATRPAQLDPNEARAAVIVVTLGYDYHLSTQG